MNVVQNVETVQEAADKALAIVAELQQKAAAFAALAAAGDDLARVDLSWLKDSLEDLNEEFSDDGVVVLP